MHKLCSVTVAGAALAMLTLNGGPAMAGQGPTDTWPATYPLPTTPGSLTSQTATTAVVRSTDTAWAVERRLDGVYVTQLGCTRELAVNKPRDYLCYNQATGKVDEIVFTFAALDPTASDPTRSQTNAYYFQG